MISDNLDVVVGSSTEVILMDLSWHLHRNYRTFQWMTAGEGGRPTGHIYGILNTIRRVRYAYPNSTIILCQDGVPVERRELMKEAGYVYKEGRPELEFNFYDDIPYIYYFASVLSRVFVAYNEDKESDDLMYALADQIQQISKAKVFVYSGDDDLLQTITDRCSVVREFNDNGFVEINDSYLSENPTMLKKYHGLKGYQLPVFRAIVGDKSDKIKGLEYFPRKIAVDIATVADGDLDKAFEYSKVRGGDDSYTRFATNEILIRNNYRLMKLSSDFNVRIQRKKVNPEKLLSLIEKFKLNSYYQYLKELGLFKRNEGD